MYTTYPIKTGDKGTVFGNARSSATRKDSARDRNDICRETSGNLRSWSGAITYNPNGTTRSQTQPCPIS